jgi:hypothetical protein
MKITTFKPTKMPLRHLFLAMFCSLLLLLVNSVFIKAQNSSRGYMQMYIGVGANAWQTRDAQFDLLFYLTPRDIINQTSSIAANSVAPNLVFGMEIGGTRSYFGSINSQFSFGGMIGSYIDVAAGINYALSDRTTFQIGAGAFYQIATKQLDRRTLWQSVRLNGRFFNNFNTFTTSLISENLGLRPFATLKFALGGSSQLRIQAGYQFNFYDNARLRFRQVRNSGRNNSNSTTARFHLDDNLFDFKYNNQIISNLPFDYSGFFVNIGLTWGI